MRWGGCRLLRVIWFLFWWLFPGVGLALQPGEVVVLANGNVAQSVVLARYYMGRRHIPEGNLLKVWVTDREACSRGEYEDGVLRVVRQYLQERGSANQVRCLVTMYGVPLKIRAPRMVDEVAAEVGVLRLKRAALRVELEGLDDTAVEKRGGIEAELVGIDERLKMLTKEDQRSALDSELALVRVDGYSLSGWVPNPNFVGFRRKPGMVPSAKIMLVSRLDGPDPKVVRRIIDDSIAVEKKGLSGVAYFDARWPRPKDEQKVEGYALYDKSIHLAADGVRRSGKMEVVVDDREVLFQRGQCPKAALYCGWYSLARYVDAFQWVRGAVGYHIASAECTTLRVDGSQVWCKRMLEEGVAATVGPTSEPYVQAFPLPEIFFGLLVDGRLSLGECYALATPYLSWQMVLIGDPLYHPFRVR